MMRSALDAARDSGIHQSFEILKSAVRSSGGNATEFWARQFGCDRSLGINVGMAWLEAIEILSLHTNCGQFATPAAL
jgi:hypothetical protein